MAGIQEWNLAEWNELGNEMGMWMWIGWTKSNSIHMVGIRKEWDIWSLLFNPVTLP